MFQKPIFFFRKLFVNDYAVLLSPSQKMRKDDNECIDYRYIQYLGFIFLVFFYFGSPIFFFNFVLNVAALNWTISGT